MSKNIEKISASDESECRQLITLTQVNDPGIMFFSPDAAKRVYHTMRMITAVSSLLNKFSHKYMIKDKNKVAAIAMWIPPGKMFSNWDFIRAGFLLIPFIMGMRVFRQIIKFLDIAIRLQEEHMKNREHWHLFYMAVHYSYQRQDYGQKVLSNIIHESDRTGKPIFVQVFTEEYVNFYQKIGFKLLSRTKFSDQCIMNCMIREAFEKRKPLKSTAKKTR